MRALDYVLFFATFVAIADPASGQEPEDRRGPDRLDVESTRLIREYTTDPDFLTEWEDKGYLGEGSHFTFVFRYGETDLDGAEKDRTVVGLNFRPNRSMTVFKLEYQWNDETGSATSVDNDGIVASVASYF